MSLFEQSIDLLTALHPLESCIAGGMLRDIDANYPIKDIDIFITEHDNNVSDIINKIDPTDVYRSRMYSNSYYGGMRDEVDYIIKFDSTGMISIDTIVTKCETIQDIVESFDASPSHIYGILNDDHSDINVYVSSDYLKYKKTDTCIIYDDINTTDRRITYLNKRFWNVIRHSSTKQTWTFYKKLSEMTI